MVKPSYCRFLLLVFILGVTLGCNILSPASPTPQKSQSDISPTQITATKAVPAPTKEIKIPTANPTPTSVIEDELEVSYIYTSGLITALYHLYGTVLDNFTDITITNQGAQKSTVIIETSIEGYSTKASDTITIEPEESVEIHQNPRLMTEAVDKLNSEQPGSFHIRITKIDSGVETRIIDDTQQILLYSRRDFVWIDGFEPQEEYELWAAWTTPTDPAVEELIRKAADYTESGIMWSGYGDHEEDDDGGVWDRLEAIWKAEDEEYNLTYVSTMVSFGPKTVQRMRLPAEVLQQASGNCVELAILYASAVEALGLEAAIIRIPGHAYVGVRMDDVNVTYYFIETTLIGRATFSEAVDRGKEEWEETSPHLDAKEEGYAWVTIKAAREKGVLPIPWK